MRGWILAGLFGLGLLLSTPVVAQPVQLQNGVEVNGSTNSATPNADFRDYVVAIPPGSGGLAIMMAYDKFGNPLTMTDVASGGMGSRTLGYDNLDRLTSATGAPAWGGNISFSYDNFDNIQSETRAGQQRVYSYSQNRLTGISNTPISGVTYDANGRTTKWGAQTLAYTPAHRLMTSTVLGDYHSEQDDRFVYDAHGHRVRSDSRKGVALQPGGMRVPYVLDQIYAQGEILQLEASGGATTCRQSNGTTVVENAPQLNNYVYLQGRRIATLSKTPASPTWNCGVTYSHSDATGTPLAFSTDSTTPSINRVSRRPYEHVGNHLTGLPGNLTYMEARYYDRNYGRFLSPDPVLPSLFDGSNFNRYAYANNNPYKFADPDGRQAMPKPQTGSPFLDWLASAFETRSSAGDVTAEQLVAEASQPMSNAERAELVLNAFSMGVGGSARGFMSSSRFSKARVDYVLRNRFQPGRRLVGAMNDAGLNQREALYAIDKSREYHRLSMGVASWGDDGIVAFGTGQAVGTGQSVNVQPGIFVSPYGEATFGSASYRATWESLSAGARYELLKFVPKEGR